MGQVHSSPLQVLQGESFSVTWTYYLNQHTITLNTSGGETGTWTATVDGQETAPLAPTATAAEVAAALNALPVVNGQGQALVGKSGTAPCTFTITWPGTVTMPTSETRDDALTVTPAFVPQRTVVVARVAKDLTGYTPYSQARVTQAPGGVLLWDSVGGSPTATFNTLGPTGAVTLTVSHTTTQALTQSGYYDVHLVSPGSLLDERFVEGPLTLEPGTTFR